MGPQVTMVTQLVCRLALTNGVDVQIKVVAMDKKK